jgi:hypothetical protein
MTTEDRNRAVDHIQAGTSASLWVDRETGHLLIMSSMADVATFQRRQCEGAFIHGAEFVCEVLDADIVREVQGFNAGMGAECER